MINSVVLRALRNVVAVCCPGIGFYSVTDSGF